MIFSISVLNQIKENPTSLINATEFSLIIVFSYYAFSRFRDFIIYNLLALAALLTLHLNNIISLNLLVLFNNVILISLALNYIKHIIDKNIANNLIVSNSIINTSSMLTILVDKNGNIKSISDNVKDILGYDDCTEFLGEPFSNFTGIELDYLEKDVNTFQSPIREIKTKQGEIKSILWEKLSFFDNNVYILGSDVTKLTILQNEIIDSNHRLESLLLNSGDLVFVFNNDLIVTEFYNKSDQQIANQNNYYINKSIKEIGINYNDTEKVLEIINEIKNTDRIGSLEYFVEVNDFKKWFDLKISSILDINHNTKKFICVARDITANKIEYFNKLDAEKKRTLQSKKLFELSFSSTENYGNIENYLKHITELVSEILEIDRVSIWNYTENQIECINCFQFSTNTHASGSILKKTDFPNYFNAIAYGLILKADNAIVHPDTYEFKDSYFNPLEIKSLMDTPIRIDGVLVGVLCCEQTKVIKSWSDEDANFAKHIADIISIEIASDLRKKAESELNKTKKMLNQSNKIAQLGAWEYNPDSKEISWSEITYEILQTDVNLDINYPICFELIKSENARLTIQSLFDNAISEGKPFDQEVEIITPKNEHRWIRIIAQPEFVEGRCLHIYGAYQNIDEQVKSRIALAESEQKFEQINETIEDVFWLFDITEKQVLYVSPSCIKVFGHHQQEYYDRYDLWKIYVDDEDKEKVQSAHDNIHINKYYEIEYRINRNDGQRWIFEKSFGIVDKNGIITKNSGICIDITNQKTAEYQIKKNKEIEGENKAKASFLANMSHEIRTPLNGVIGLTDLLKKTSLDATQANYVTTVNDSALLLQGIINNILDYSKLDSGHFELNPETHNLRDICTKIYNILKYHAQEKNLVFNFHISPDVPPCIEIDDIRLKQILLNLISNAVKFTEKGKIDFIIGKIKSDGVEKIRFSVIDTGIGIRDENKVRIFEAFTQEDSSTTKKYGGTGLGLAISSKLLSMMGSKIYIDSEVGKGSHFYFDLTMNHFILDPNECIIPSDTENQHVYHFTNELINQITSHGLIKIMLVEDNKVNLFLLKSILKDLLPSSSFYEAVNGQEAVELYQNVQPDIIFMDIQMPIMNGIEATQRIRAIETTRSIPIIAVTAGTTEGEGENCLSVGMNDFLTKPIVRNSIEKTLKQFLNIEQSTKDVIEQIQSNNLHIDFQKLEEANKSNGVYLKSIFPYIKESLLEGQQELHLHFNNKDIKSINLVAHRLKGTALTASFSKLTILCKELEMTKEFNIEIVQNLLNQIDEELNYLIPIL